MRDHPILFSAPMVRALLAGTKTQTRRIHSNQSPKFIRTCDENCDSRLWTMCISPTCNRRTVTPTKINKGDRLWVRETFSYDNLDVDHDRLLPAWYWADGNPEWGDWTRPKPSIHMPRAYSRITLLVEDVRIERLQSISEEDAIAEGVVKAKVPFEYDEGDIDQDWYAIPGFDDPGTGMSAVDMYSTLWDHINEKRGVPWSSNPWVVAYTFRVVLENIDYIGRAA